MKKIILGLFLVFCSVNTGYVFADALDELVIKKQAEKRPQTPKKQTVQKKKVDTSDDDGADWFWALVFIGACIYLSIYENKNDKRKAGNSSYNSYSRSSYNSSYSSNYNKDDYEDVDDDDEYEEDDYEDTYDDEEEYTYSNNSSNNSYHEKKSSYTSYSSDPYKKYYDILGVSEYATEAEVKKAYHALIKKYHPDRNHGDKKAEEKMKEINNAFDELMKKYK